MASNAILSWFGNLGFVTRSYFFLSVVFTLFFALGIVDANRFFLDWSKVFWRLQIWRLFSCFLWIDQLGFNLCMQLYFLIQYGNELERHVKFRVRKCEYALYSLRLMACLVCSSYFITGSPALGAPYIMSLIYTWSRLHPNLEVLIYGFAIEARYLPFIMAGLHFFMGGNPIPDIMGILCGHLMIFLTEILPTEYDLSSFQLSPKVYNYLNYAIEQADSFEMQIITGQKNGLTAKQNPIDNNKTQKDTKRFQGQGRKLNE